MPPAGDDEDAWFLFRLCAVAVALDDVEAGGCDLALEFFGREEHDGGGEADPLHRPYDRADERAHLLDAGCLRNEEPARLQQPVHGCELAGERGRLQRGNKYWSAPLE